MDISKHFSDLMTAFGDFFTAFTEVSFEYFGMEISVKAIIIWSALAVVVIKRIMQ